MTEQEAKLEFAVLINKGEPPIVAAESLLAYYNVDATYITYVARTWPSDPVVVAELKRLTNRIPTQDEMALEILQKAREVAKNRGYDEANKLYRTAGEMLGMLGANASKKDTKKAADKLDMLAEMIGLER